MKSLNDLATICLVLYVIYLLRKWSGRLAKMFPAEDEPWRESLRPDGPDEKE